MNNPDHNSKSLETIFQVKILNSLIRIWDPGWKKFGSGTEKFGSGTEKFGSGMENFFIRNGGGSVFLP
jgi:hypothetical protein